MVSTTLKGRKEERQINKSTLYHTKTIQETCSLLKTSVDKGLTETEVQRRLEVYGKNKLKEKKGVNPVLLFLSHFANLIMFILFLAAIASFVTAGIEQSKDWIEGVVILAIIIINAIIGFAQEYRSEKTMESLKKMFAPSAKVLRDGVTKSIESFDLVPGDIVFIEEGDYVPADLRLAETINLQIDEALITGESVPANKGTAAIKNENEALGDRLNMAYMTSIVSKGRATGIVVYTGDDTQIGEIAKSLKQPKKKQKTKLQASMQRMALFLFVAAIMIALVIIAIQLLAFGVSALGNKEVWLYIICVVVAIIPEGLVAVLTLTMALGVRLMAKKNAVVRKLNALESLSAVTDICSDKTGTLTEGKMVASDLWVSKKAYTVSGTGIIPEGNILRNGTPIKDLTEDLRTAITIMALCNTSTIQKVNDEWVCTGDPTEIALQVLAAKVKMNKDALKEKYTFLGEYAFDSVWKRMSVIYNKNENSNSTSVVKKEEPPQEKKEEEPKDSQKQDEKSGESIELKEITIAEAETDKKPETPLIELAKDVDPKNNYLFMKGSVESVMSICTSFQMDGQLIPFSRDHAKQILTTASAMAKKGLRVLALAWKKSFTYTQDTTREEACQNMTFLGLVGIYDPPRPESKGAVHSAHKAGINVYMLTGDHIDTAVTIAKQVGIVQDDFHDKAVLGTDFEAASVAAGTELPKVVARCNPSSKIKMINQIHARGGFVVMTGDGVNDAPAVKEADVGIAMGKGGSEVTKQAADIVIMDDNFHTIIVAIEEGRRIFANIQKCCNYLMTNNLAEVFILVLGLIFSFFVKETLYPLAPLQILWLNCITDTPSCIVLGVEPASPDVMKVPPRKKKEGVFTPEIIVDVLIYGSIVGALSLLNFALVLFVFKGGDLSKSIDPFSGQEIVVSVYQARATAFCTISICMLFHGFNCMHHRLSAFQVRYKNKYIFFTVVISIIVTVATVYIPWVNVMVFQQVGLEVYEWAIVIAAIILFLILSELYKFLKRTAIACHHNTKNMLENAAQIANSIHEIAIIIKDQHERSTRVHTEIVEE